MFRYFTVHTFVYKIMRGASHKHMMTRNILVSLDYT